MSQTNTNTQTARSWSNFPAFVMVVAFIFIVPLMFTTPTPKQTAKAGEIVAAVTETTTKAVETKAEGVIAPTGVIEAKTVASEVKLNDKTELEPINSKTLAFVNSYPGSRLKGQYIQTLAKYCDTQTLKVVVSIATAEGGLGRELPNRQSNFWGWFAGGNKNYDPDRETMAQVICEGIKTVYPGLIQNGVVNYSLATIYSGNDRPKDWVNIVQWAYNQMN